MIKELVKDEAILSKPCEKATAEDAALAQDLVDTLDSLGDASCLAANQIGVSKAVCALTDDNGHDYVFYNPKLLFGIRPYKTEEGCLTKDAVSKVTRYQKIRVSYQELKDGKLVSETRDFVGWYAQMIQHMIDHCQGKLV